MRSYNDDLVMSFAIGCWVRDTVIVESQKNVEYDKQMIAGISTSKTNISTTIPGMNSHKITAETQRQSEAQKFTHDYYALIKG